MNKVWRKGVPFDAAVAPLVGRMPLVDEYRETLLRLHGMWDTLALLGQMSGSMAEIGRTREEFQGLSHTLLDSLARQQLRDAVHGLRGRAQVAIDVLVRNLFERTADVGFLSTDALVRAVADGDSTHRAALEARFAAYVAKYSVYDEVVLLDPSGGILARLDASRGDVPCQEPWLAEARRAGVPFVERFGPTSLLGGRSGLLYAAAVRADDGRLLGVLCLSFRFDDEMRRLFARLLDAGDATVVALVDAAGTVVASSDTWQLPLGMTVPPPRDGVPLVRLGGRDCLGVRAAPTGFQGHAGPGWDAAALVAVDVAFDDERHAADADASDALARTLDTRDIFDEELRAIPPRAGGIQRALAQSVWNGKLRLGRAPAAAGTTDLAAALLKEVSATGERIRVVFGDAIARLERAGLSAVREQARFQAGLAIDIVERNLYERANDCRWWALDPQLQAALAHPGDTTAAAAAAVLVRTHALYPVYALLVLFDAGGRVVAVSDPARQGLVGSALDDHFVRATLALRDGQAFHVSPHKPTPLYAGEATFIYGAAVRCAGDGVGPGAAVASAAGGVAIVFDGTRQFRAMLDDALPAVTGAAALLLDRTGRVVAGTDGRFAVGAPGPLDSRLLGLARGSTAHDTVEIDGIVHAVGVGHSGGYREYRSDGPARADDLLAAVLLPLGARRPAAHVDLPAFVPRPVAGVAGPGGEPVHIAGFMVDGAWFGLPADRVEEALVGRHVTPLPNTRPPVLGVVSWQDVLVAVVDLGAWQARPTPTRADGPLLVCRTPQGGLVALRVDALGDVFSVPGGSLRAWQSPVDGSPLHLLGGQCGGQPSMLTVLSLASLPLGVTEATPAASALMRV